MAYRSSELLPNCLAGVSRHCPDAQVVVVDNSSEAALEQLVDQPTVTLIDPGENLGYARGVQRGFEALSPADLLLVLNPDTELLVDPRVLAPYLHDADLVSGLLISSVASGRSGDAHNARPSVTLWREFLAAFIGSRAYRMNPDLTRPQRVDQLDGAYLLMTRTWYESHPMDPRFELYYEDVALCDRAQEGHGCLWVPVPCARHSGGDSSRRSPLPSYRVLRVSRARYLRSKYRHLPWFVMAPLFFIEAGMRAVTRRPDPDGSRLSTAVMAVSELRRPGSVSVLSSAASSGGMQ